MGKKKSNECRSKLSPCRKGGKENKTRNDRESQSLKDDADQNRSEDEGRRCCNQSKKLSVHQDDVFSLGSSENSEDNIKWDGQRHSNGNHGSQQTRMAPPNHNARRFNSPTSRRGIPRPNAIERFFLKFVRLGTTEFTAHRPSRAKVMPKPEYARRNVPYHRSTPHVTRRVSCHYRGQSPGAGTCNDNNTKHFSRRIHPGQEWTNRSSGENDRRRKFAVRRDTGPLVPNPSNRPSASVIRRIPLPPPNMCSLPPIDPMINSSTSAISDIESSSRDTKNSLENLVCPMSINREPTEQFQRPGVRKGHSRWKKSPVDENSTHRIDLHTSSHESEL